MSLLRQSRHYLLFGLVQWVVEWLVMVGLSHGGMAVEPANVAGRIAGALLGFNLNGRITFANEGSALGRTQLLRYIAMWLATTAVSTAGVGLVDAQAGLHWAWILKPGVDLIAGGLGFLISRHWVYRR